MALHNTQCPYCFITYVISDEQLRVSEGMVRCGTCRERFQARILKGEIETPRFDPRDAFIEPLTDEFDEQKKAAAKAFADTEPQEFSFGDVHTESEKSISMREATISGSINSDLSLDIDEDAPITPVDSNQLSAADMLANIRAKQAREAQQKKEAVMEVSPDAPDANIEVVTPEKAKLVEPIRGTSSEQALKRKRVEPAPLSSVQHANKEALIDEVDSLIDNKLVNGASVSASVSDAHADIERPFQLDRTPPIRTRAWLLAPPLLIVVALLGCGLIYQLWMKQILVFEVGSMIEKKITELSVPLATRLAEHKLVLPVRRNLSLLELVSARTEAHPTRSSTTLLKISVINHATFEQPLPWLEMTLSDAEGRLVSRRSLSPQDYIYQNASNDLIGARELKKVTIELLSFPKKATGYEIKILSK